MWISFFLFLAKISNSFSSLFSFASFLLFYVSLFFFLFARVCNSTKPIYTNLFSTHACPSRDYFIEKFLFRVSRKKKKKNLSSFTLSFSMRTVCESIVTHNTRYTLWRWYHCVVRELCSTLFALASLTTFPSITKLFVLCALFFSFARRSFANEILPLQATPSTTFKNVFRCRYNCLVMFSCVRFAAFCFSRFAWLCAPVHVLSMRLCVGWERAYSCMLRVSKLRPFARIVEIKTKICVFFCLCLTVNAFAFDSIAQEASYALALSPSLVRPNTLYKT